MKPVCKNCYESLKKDSYQPKRTEGFFGMICGFILFVFIPIIGWILGPIVGLYSLHLSTLKIRYYRCPACNGKYTYKDHTIEMKI